MGIYIKGLKAPASCCKCRFSRWSNYGQVYMCNVCEKPVAKLSSVYESTKPDWCPVAEVQEPHGDLIDRDALEADICPDWNGLYVPDNAYSEKCGAMIAYPADEFYGRKALTEDEAIEAWNRMAVRGMSITLEQAIKHAEEVANEQERLMSRYDAASGYARSGNEAIRTESAKKCEKCAAEHKQLAAWLSILKKAKFEYDEAWRIITHPTPDVTYADKERAQVILDTFRDSLGRMEC